MSNQTRWDKLILILFFSLLICSINFYVRLNCITLNIYRMENTDTDTTNHHKTASMFNIKKNCYASTKYTRYHLYIYLYIRSIN